MIHVRGRTRHSADRNAARKFKGLALESCTFRCEHFYKAPPRHLKDLPCGTKLSRAMASSLGILNFQSLNELTSENGADSWVIKHKPDTDLAFVNTISNFVNKLHAATLGSLSVLADQGIPTLPLQGITIQFVLLVDLISGKDLVSSGAVQRKQRSGGSDSGGSDSGSRRSGGSGFHRRRRCIRGTACDAHGAHRRAAASLPCWPL